MSENQVKILERALDRAKKARKQAEQILEQKSLELYETNQKLESANKMMEALLDDSSSQMNIIFENSSLGIFLSSKKTLVKTNQALSDLLGYSKAEFSQLTINDVSFKEDLEETYKVLDYLEKGEINKFSGKKRFKKKNGDTIICNVNLNSIRKPNGEVKYLVALLEDVTLKSRQARMLKLLNELSVSILGKTSLEEISWEIAKKVSGFLKLEDCVIYAVNEIDKKLYQVATYDNKLDNENQIINPIVIDFGEGIVGTVALKGKPELINDTSKDSRYIEDDIKRYSELAVPILANNKVIGVIDSEHSRKNYFNKEHLDVFTNVANLAAAQFNSVISLNKERSLDKERLVLLENLEHRNEELKNFAHVVSHDLKSPLRSMNALINWILEDNDNGLGFDLNTRNNFSMLLKKIDKMDHLINGILKYASIGKTTNEFQDVNTHELIEDIIDVIHIPNHITVRIKNNLPVLYIEKFKLQQLFQNLIVNAIKYNDKEIGIVEIGVEEGEDSYTFSVSDNGIGIDKKYHTKIFEVFETLDNTSEDSTGIGLSIVHKIVNMYHGKLWLESELGLGTTFYVKFPK
ncbi:sensor histidine kinase [Pseudofulvibacter geojedonensis]|uniref:histidine kinase n=1 Tax=Pseudofulvibacter geojedonensis TaxID=1123758 RepID=A0ABW3I4Q2_9FLAO